MYFFLFLVLVILVLLLSRMYLQLDQKSDAVMVLNMILDQLVNVEWVAHQQLILAKVRKGGVWGRRRDLMMITTLTRG